MSGTLVMVVGLLQGRDPEEMLRALGADQAGIVVACTPPWPRAIPSTELAATADAMGVTVEVVPDVGSAVERALALATTDDLVLVTGSLYVVGAARTALTLMQEDPSW